LSLAAKILIDPDRRLLGGWIALGGGGCALALITIVARWRAGESIALLCVFTGFAAIAAVSLFARGIGRQKPFLLTLSEDGSVEYEILESKGHAAIDLQAVGSYPCYRLSAGSLFWPGFQVLRLDPMVPGPVESRTPDRAGIVSLIVFDAWIPHAGRRALARFMIWAQNKSTFIDRPRLDSPPNGDESI
jgi:hypothetical protein